MNWNNLIKELRACGLSQADIATKIDCHQTLISYWVRTGVEPKWSTGEKLIALHRRELEARRVAA